MDQKLADIALIGLAVMGRNLALNISDHGYTVVVYNRTLAKVDEFIMEEGIAHPKLIGARSIEEMVKRLKRPRKILLMVQAGEAVDSQIAQILPFLDKDDIIIDGGNSHFVDTIRRTKVLSDKGILFVGAGISGGEEGARHGPSIMPGGNVSAWPEIKDIFQAICAKTPSGESCCEWVGSDGAGHFVKMVHNGIEYGDMQLISEAYYLLKHSLNMGCDELHDIFLAWNSTDLNSYLIKITADILAKKDEDQTPLLDKILDAAGQKGTGKWTSFSALDLGIPVTLISEAVFARALSSLKDERTEASKILTAPETVFTGQDYDFIEDVRQALLSCKIVSYSQGFMLLRAASQKYGWDIDFGKIALIWRAGCIIRSVFLDKISAAFTQNPKLLNLMLDNYFSNILINCQDSWRRVIMTSIEMGIPIPAFSAALTFYDSYRSEFLPANLIQAQRDYFGAHTYERVDRPRGEFFHTDWS